LTLRRRPGPGERRFDLTVSGLGGAERIADFALRVGAAAGLPFYRVTLNEGGRFAIELRADARPGFEPVPAVEGRGGAGSGALSSAVAAAVATERLPPFDPSAFRGNARVTVWEPGREVRFDKGWGAQVLLCPLLLAAALGPLSFVRMSSVQAMPLLPRTVTLVMLTLIGFGLAAVGWAGLYTGLPRHVRLDWSAGMLHVETLRRKRATPLTDIAGVELRHKSYSTGRARGGMVRTSCWSQVRLRRHGPADPPDELLAETRTFRNDASPPREMALPLARELAAALRVAVVETGRSRESS
jgi:hypothetical protein